MTVVYVVPADDNIPHSVIVLIMTGTAIALTAAFVVCAVESFVASKNLKMHKLHTFIQINEKSLVVSEFLNFSFIKNSAVKILFICDIRDIDDFLLTGNKIVIKLKTAAAKRYIGDVKSLILSDADDTLVVNDEGLPYSDVKKITITDAFALPLRIAQRIFLVAGNVREKEARRNRFRQEMLERAAKAPRYKTLRDRFRPELKKIKRF
jgi:hypothetical protein